MITAVVLTIIITALVTTMALMKTSSKASRVEEQRRKYKYCDDRCVDCSESGNCMFSEVDHANS